MEQPAEKGTDDDKHISCNFLGVDLKPESKARAGSAARCVHGLWNPCRRRNLPGIKPSKNKPMNSKWLLMMLPIGAGLQAETAAPPPIADFLYAIRQVESGDRYDCPQGRGGEIGPYQFRPEVWHRYTDAPFSAARTPLSDSVAARHFLRIVQRLVAHGIAANAWNIAAVWNSGEHAVISGRIPRATWDYATRVENLTQYAASLRREGTAVAEQAYAVGG
jgi:hypothetical protein